MGTTELIEYVKTHKDENVKKAGLILEHVFSSPYLNTYLTMKSTMAHWDNEIKEECPSIFITTEVIGEKTIVKDEYKNVSDYFGDMGKLIKSLEDLRSKLLPNELSKAEKERPMRTEEILDRVLKRNGNR